MININNFVLAERTGFNCGHAISSSGSPACYDYATLEKVLKAVKATGGRLVRFDFNMERSLDGGIFGAYEPFQKDIHAKLFTLAAQLDLIPTIVINSELPNRFSYRNFAATSLNRPDLLDPINFSKFINRRKGVNRIWWPIFNKLISEILKQGAEIYAKAGKSWAGHVTVEFENEGGYVIDSEYNSDPSIPYGTFPVTHNEMIVDRLNGPQAINLYGAVFMPSSFEALQGLDTEINTSLGEWRKFSPLVNVHLYVPYKIGDTKENLALKLIEKLKMFILKIDAVPELKGKGIAITEFGVSDLPVNLRKEYLTYIGKQLTKSSSRVKMAIAYAMVEISYDYINQKFVPSKWGALDFEALKYAPQDIAVDI